jgi:hypothetical protein
LARWSVGIMPPAIAWIWSMLSERRVGAWRGAASWNCRRSDLRREELLTLIAQHERLTSVRGPVARCDAAARDAAIRSCGAGWPDARGRAVRQIAASLWNCRR